jgi:hypothetical protein
MKVTIADGADGIGGRRVRSRCDGKGGWRNDRIGDGFDGWSPPTQFRLRHRPVPPVAPGLPKQRPENSQHL